MFFYVENNEKVVKNVENDYYFGYTSTFSANLTSDFCSETTCSGLLNMNGRMYDSVIARVLSPDNFVVDPTNAQAYNRYSYVLNNPMRFVDPSGESLIAIGIGAMIGAFITAMVQGWSGTAQTPGQIMGSFGIGAISGALGSFVTTSTIPMANTFGIMAGSFSNSVGNHIITGGKTDVSVSLGFASYNFDKNEWGYLGKKGNKWYENVGYGLGALANLSDILTGFNHEDVDLVTDPHNGSGHSAIVEKGTSTATGYGNGNPAKADPNGIISVGPNRYTDPRGSWHWMKGTNKWDTYSDNLKAWRQTLTVNRNTINKYVNWLNAKEAAGKLIYSVELSSCVTHTSRALNMSGIFNIGIHPYLLNAQMYLWSNGIRPWSFNYLLFNY
jgi:RHS repeat-associated protein